MILDAQNQFSDAQAVTATAISANVVDTHAPGTNPNVTKDLGTGEDLYLVIAVTETVTAAGAATVTFALESDSDAGLTTSPTVHFTTAAIPKATLVAGYEVAKFRLPAGSYERYLGVRYTVATGPLTAGKFDAFLVKDVDAYKAYADNVTIS
jgi:hypothetical protein